MRRNAWKKTLLAGGICLMMASYTYAGVSPEEAAQLKTTLTPMGAERAGNKEGTIPAWTGGYTTPDPNFKGGKRSDPFPGDKPLFTITAKNMDQYAAKLDDGTKAMLKKYPDYRLDVYQTRRTEAAPQWVYDNTYKNALRGQIVNLPSGPTAEHIFGGVPFPIPKTGAEVMWNLRLQWSGSDIDVVGTQYMVTSDGRAVLTSDNIGQEAYPYFYKELGSPEAYEKKYDGNYWSIRLVTTAPAIRAGEAITGRQAQDDDKTHTWVYLTGQRRVRMLPNPCCDTPSPAMAGLMSFDELDVFGGRMDRFNWKLLGKQEMYIPYNCNRSMLPTKDSAVIGKHFLNPDLVRWELHRVWVVEATLKPGHRHPAARSLYYVDEDSWEGALGDRWDAKGRLWKQLWTLSEVIPDLPGNIPVTFGFYDMTSSSWYVANLMNEKPVQYAFPKTHYPERIFTPDAMASESVR
jgi:hypothetical protein